MKTQIKPKNDLNWEKRCDARKHKIYNILNSRKIKIKDILAELSKG